MAIDGDKDDKEYCEELREEDGYDWRRVKSGLNGAVWDYYC